MVAAATDPTVQADLSADDREKRVKVLTARIRERASIREQKSAQNEQWNNTLKLLNEQIDTLAAEIESGKAWIPAQMVMPGTDDEGPGDEADDQADPDDDDDEIAEVPVAAKPAEKKRAAKKANLRSVK